MMNNKKAALRMTALAAMLAMGGMTAGCSDNDDGGPAGGGGGGGGGVGGAADLSTPAGAKAAAGTLLVISDLATGIEDGGLVALPGPKAAVNCEDGGTVEDSSANDVNVASPFNKNVNVARTTRVNCKIAESNEAGSVTITQDGVVESGESTTANPLVSYFRLGKGAATATTPYTFSIEQASEQGAGFNGTYGFFYRVDGSEGETGEEQRLVFDMNVKFKVTAPGVPAGQIPQITYQAAFGSTASPFTIKSNNAGVELNGSYGASISTPQGNADTGCSNGSVKVTTKTVLTPAVEQVSPFSAGELELESGGKKAKIVFVGDKIRVTPPGGTEVEFTGTELQQAGSACAGLALSGLLLAGALGQ